uniref:HAMP domain-containing methyl-accepting chemotaxis protein n=1 Tax=Clostridium tyrobutyricum TaxID=1519 RepID=UPI0003633BC4
MKLLSNVNIFKKLMISFIIVAIFTCIVGIVSLNKTKVVKKNLDNIYNIDLKETNNLKEIKINLLEMQTDLLSMINKENRPQLNNLINDFNQQIQQNTKLLSTYSGSLNNKNNVNKDLMDQFEEYRKSWKTSRENYIQLIQKGDYNGAIKEFQTTEKYRKNLFSVIDQLIDKNLKFAQNDYNTSISQYNSSLVLVTLLVVVSFIVSILLGLAMAKDVHNPLLKIKNLADRLAKFDFSTDIKITRSDEFGHVGNSLNTAQNNIIHLLKSIMENSENMGSASEELSATAEELSAKAENMDNSA